LYSLKRRDLLEILSRACEDHPNIVFIHCTRILDIDFENSKLICQSSQSDPKICSFRDGFLVVADGANSHLCSAMHRSGYSEVSRSKFRWRYTELSLSPDQARQHRLVDHSLHIWQSKNALLVGMPNLDGSYSCNLFLSDQLVPNSCDELLPSHYNALVLSGCPEFLLDIGCEASNQTLKLHTLTTVNMTRWYYRDQIVVLGDACHAVLPFYGQGMNAALEDAFKLAECLVEAQFQREPAFRSFQQRRQSDTRALALLSEQHLEFLNSTRSIPRQQSQQLIDTVLTNLFSPIWPHVYELVAQTDLPYKVAQRAASRKAILRRFLGVVIIEELTALVLKFWQSKCDGSISELKAFLLNQPVIQGDLFRSR
jgi:kynurenine 3-monooxygenase